MYYMCSVNIGCLLLYYIATYCRIQKIISANKISLLSHAPPQVIILLPLVVVVLLLILFASILHTSVDLSSPPSVSW